MFVVDLTHPLTPGTPVFEGDPEVTLALARTGRVICAFLPLALPNADGAPVRAVAWK
jgi:kynurenine formamidase